MNRLLLRTTFTLAMITLTATSGCAGKSFVAHVYPGPERAPAEVAEIVVLPRVRLMSVDGKRVDTLPVDPAMSDNAGARRTLYLLPGKHRLIAGIAAEIRERPNQGFGGMGSSGNVGFGGGVTFHGGPLIRQGSKSNDEIEFTVEAGKRYNLATTRYNGADEADSRLTLREREKDSAPEIQKFIARSTFEDPYGTRAPATSR